MIKKDYEVSMHEDRSVYGVEWDISVPENNNPVIVAQDVFGEVEEHMQLLIYPPTDVEGEVENAISVRFNKDGSFAGTVMPNGVSSTSWDETTVSDWLKTRDGATASESKKLPPQESELSKLRSVIGDLCDVLEAHAVHEDHSDTQLQEWADVGRRAIGDYKGGKMMNIFKPEDILVVLEGGLVQSVCIGSRELREHVGNAVVIDYDTEGADPDEITAIQQSDDTTAEAIIHSEQVTEPLIGSGGDV